VLFVAIRRYAVEAEADEIARRLGEGLVPILRQQPGFKGYCVFLTEGQGQGQGQIGSLTVFDDKPASDAACGPTDAWIEANMRDLLPAPPMITAGVVQHYEIADERHRQERRDDALFVVIREYEGAEPSQETIPLMHEHILPLMRGRSGFRGFYVFRDEERVDHVVAVSLWDSRREALAAHQRVLEAVAERMQDVFPNPPRVTAGATRILASA
jgi:heme-degrading monooxygenase HmoA